MPDSTPPPPRRGARPSSPPQEGTPEYDWLYGSRGAPASGENVTEHIPVQNAGGPDSTRVMPVQPQPSASDAVTRARPHSSPPPTAPGGFGAVPPSGGGSGRGFRDPRPRLRWLKWIVALWLVFIVATPVFAYFAVSHVDAFPDDEGRPDDQPGTTYLLVGSDSRSADTKGTRTDTIMLLHTGSGPNLLMSLPRDSQVEIPGHGTTKINAAYAYGGAPLLVRTVENNTGIKIDHFVEIGFQGLVDLVDAVGGVEVCPKQAIEDEKAKLKISKGCQEVDGTTALAYSRARHFDATGDIARAQNQREVVSAIGDKVLSPWTVINPVRWWRVNQGAASSVRVSDGTGPIALGNFGLAMTRVNGESGLTCVVPLADLSVRWDPERSEQVFKYIIDDDISAIESRRKTLCTPKGLP